MQSEGLPSEQSTVTMISNYPELSRSSGPNSDQDLSTGEDKIQSEPSSPPPEFVRAITGFKWGLVCAGFYASAFLYGLDNTIAADIQSAVVEQFDDISKLTWLGSGFPLGSIATILTL